MMDRPDDKLTDPEIAKPEAAVDLLEVSEWGLDWGDISLIRDKLELTPTERLQVAQDFMNTILRIRAQNVYRAPI